MEGLGGDDGVRNDGLLYSITYRIVAVETWLDYLIFPIKWSIIEILSDILDTI